LFEGTQRDNIIDMHVKGRQIFGNLATLTEDEVREIRQMLASGRYYQRDIGYAFGVSQSNISMIKNSKTWASVPDEEE
jgi:hypothetical protein